MGPDEGSSRHPALITVAEHSLDDQRRARIRRYSILMGFRIPALIVAAWVYTTFHSPIGAIIIVLASVPLPWMAVLIANDRPPRRKDEPSRYPRELREQRALEARFTAIADPRIVDSDMVDSDTVDSDDADRHPGGSGAVDPHSDTARREDSHTVGPQAEHPDSAG